MTSGHTLPLPIPLIKKSVPFVLLYPKHPGVVTVSSQSSEADGGEGLKYV
jgi:hypothetical protein